MKNINNKVKPTKDLKDMLRVVLKQNRPTITWDRILHLSVPYSYGRILLLLGYAIYGE